MIQVNGTRLWARLPFCTSPETNFAWNAPIFLRNVAILVLRGVYRILAWVRSWYRTSPLQTASRVTQGLPIIDRRVLRNWIIAQWCYVLSPQRHSFYLRGRRLQTSKRIIVMLRALFTILAHRARAYRLASECFSSVSVFNMNFSLVFFKLLFPFFLIVALLPL